MNPNQQLDQSVVNLAKAIRSVETQGQKDPYTARGASGEYGAYQYTPGTWNKDSQAFLGRTIPLEKADRATQNQVAYMKIKSLKDQGLNVGQIASMWNSGKPDAYLDSGFRGVNKHGVRFDVPQYAKSVATAYQSIKGSGEPTITPITSSTVGHQQIVEPEQPSKGFLGTNPNDSLYGKVIDNSITRGIQKFFPGAKIGEAIGTLGGFAATKAKDALAGTNVAEHYDLSAPSPLQVAGDAASALITAGAGLPGKAISVFGKSVPLMQQASSAIGRVGQAGLLGGSLGASTAVAEGGDFGDVAKGAGIGALTGGVLGGTAEVIQKIAHVLPKRIARSFIGSPANEESIEYAVKKGLGSPVKMLQESRESIRSLGNQLGRTLEAPKYANIKIKGTDILDDVINQFPDAGLDRVALVANLKRVAPLKAAALDKLLTKEFTLKELHSINSAIGNKTYKPSFDDPTVKAGKELGNAMYQQVSKIIKNKAKDTVPLFDDLSREYPLSEALDRAIKRGLKAKKFTFFDAAALLGGFHLGGLTGGAGVWAGEKLLRSPSVNLKAAGLISNFGGQGAQSLQRGLQAPVLGATGGLIQRLQADRASQ